MPGLRFYADTFAYWIEQLSLGWAVLQSNIIEMLDSFADKPFVAGAFFNVFRNFLFQFDFAHLSVLEFMLTCLGAAFGLYFVITMIKWVLDVIT